MFCCIGVRGQVHLLACVECVHVVACIEQELHSLYPCTENKFLVQENDIL